MPITLRDKRAEVIESFTTALDKVIAGSEHPADNHVRGELYKDEVSKPQALFEVEMTLTFHGSRVRIVSKPDTIINEAPPGSDSSPPPDTDPSPTQESLP